MFLFCGQRIKIKFKMENLKWIVSLLFFSLNVTTSLGQSKTSQEIGLAGKNILFGGIVSGIGSGLNKEHSESFTKAFLRGFKWGSVGGFVVYLGKKTSYTINSTEQLYFGWGTKLVHSLGTSIIYNSAIGESPFSKYYTNVGFIRFEINLNEKFNTKVKVMPFSLGSFIYGLTKHSIVVDESLKLGTPLFIADSSFFEGRFLGLSGYNTIMIAGELKEFKFRTIAHENIHTMQFNEFYTLNTWFNKPQKKINDNIQDSKTKQILFDYIFLDVPYQKLINSLYPSSGACFYKNPFELEAEHFAINNYIKRCY